MVTKGESREAINQEFGSNIYTLEQVNNKDLLYNTGNYTQYFVITYMGKNLKKIYVYITESLGCTPETNNSIVNQLYFDKK